MNASTTQKMQNLSAALRALAEAFDSFTNDEPEQSAQRSNGHRKAPLCPECNAPMKSRTSARGPFWGCSNYPHCQAIRKIGGQDWRSQNRSAQIESGRDD
jgi:ssDNA-binding Zn-finger/Zn-ribbon topoisomerase 1